MSEELVINVKKGIAYAANNSQLYKQLLGTFVSQYAQSDVQLTDFLSQGKNDEAMKLSHSMKGVCATLGMDSLSEVAKRMQIGFAANQVESMKPEIDTYSQLLTKALVEAKAYIAS